MNDKTGLTIAQACASSGLGRTKLYAAINDGDLPARKCGRRTIIIPAELSQYLESLPAIGDEAARPRGTAGRRKR